MFITGPPNGPVLFCSLVSVGAVSSVGVICNAAGGRAVHVGGRTADTAWRASTVTSC